jgi:hypothetical protein
MNNKEHLTIEGLHKIVAIKASPSGDAHPTGVASLNLVAPRYQMN